MRNGSFVDVHEPPKNWNAINASAEWIYERPWYGNDFAITPKIVGDLIQYRSYVYKTPTTGIYNKLYDDVDVQQDILYNYNNEIFAQPYPLDENGNFYVHWKKGN